MNKEILEQADLLQINHFETTGSNTDEALDLKYDIVSCILIC